MSQPTSAHSTQPGPTTRALHLMNSTHQAKTPHSAAPPALGPETLAILERIVERAFAQTMHMIHLANTRTDKRPGDPKVGGHPASCASSMHILSALHLVVRQPADYVCCKPHASPVDHSLHHLMQLFRRSPSDSPGLEAGTWLTPEEQKRAMTGLRQFANSDNPDVFQSYHARTDPDSFHFLPSGSVGIPPVVSVYMALAYRYASDHRWQVPQGAHFWSLIGDSEFREGSLLEVLPDAAERNLSNVTWIVDYNRQNLDGTRIPNERSLRGADCDRIERTAAANGWKVIQLRHGALRQRLFAMEDGDALRELFEGALSDYEYQQLLFSRDPARMRQRGAAEVPRAKRLLERLSDEELLAAFADLGGHDMAQIVRVLNECRLETQRPTLVIAHTVKGWHLE